MSYKNYNAADEEELCKILLRKAVSIRNKI